MTKQIVKTYFFFILLLALSCTNSKNKSKLDSDLTVTIDSNLVENFLKDPRNNLLINKLKYQIQCDVNENQNRSEQTLVVQKYYDCVYLKEDKKIAEIKSSVFKTDSTWTFGTNGFELYFFETNKKTFPLKHGLKVGSTIEDFNIIFGISKKINTKYSYAFEFESFSSIMVLESENNTITKITIANKSN